MGPPIVLWIASVLGVAFGVAVVKERRTSSVFPTVLAATLLGTVVTTIAFLSTGEADAAIVLMFVPFVLILGLPVAPGALVGALWRLVLRLLDRKSTKLVNGVRLEQDAAGP